MTFEPYKVEIQKKTLWDEYAMAARLPTAVLQTYAYIKPFKSLTI